ncbi:MAG: ABC transporter permease [Lachnospiraceae bacterium]|nr:ABC transporter permease [Lachnospiraceae bacterium]
MTRYIVKRVLLAIVSVFIICAITFFAMNAIPGGPFNSEKALSEATRQVLEQRYNLDKPVPVQFVLYLKNLLHGDFGVSLKTGRDIKDTLFSCFKVSGRLGLTAAVLAVITGIILGSMAALFRNGPIDRIIVFFTTLFTAMPSFVFATFLMLVFCIKLRWLPVWDASSKSLILPVIALAAYPTAYVTRLTKTSMLDSLGQDYIRTARAKGVPMTKVIFKHALRNALIPVITYVGPMLAYILTGSLVVENIFTIGGLGQQFVKSINNRDYPMIMATTIFLAVVMVICNLLSDIAYKVVDPRITLD